ncbi:MAG: phosphatidate cytidylyltransferase [Gammaproteobacteria bacterium]|nr:MAG: phosphatidate cytidylyltransferase [Gammaproteobacteria bacterium]
MLRQRLVSALIMVPLVVLAVLKLDMFWFALLAAALMLLAAWEWGSLIPLRDTGARIGYLALILALIAVSWRSARAEIFVDTVLWAALAWWLFVLFWITRPALGAGETGAHSLAKALLGCGLMVSTWLALVVLHSRPDQGPHWVLYLLVLVWVADSGAFFAGRQFGHTRLAPKVSPGKTWEGVFGALIACALFAFGYAIFLELRGAALTAFILVSLVTVLFSIAGDLLESLLKRQHGVKDSGTLIPGHGGILDRIDSLFAAAPIFLFGLRWTQL